MAGNSTKLFSSWFCPFAQRCWIALAEKGVPFALEEIDPFNKTPELLALNPRGLVPTLLHDGKTVYESSVVNEFICDVWPQEPRLMPDDPYLRSQARIWVDFVGKKVVPPFYFILQKQAHEDQEESTANLIDSLQVFTKAMSDQGPYFFGADLSLVDIALLPFVLRLYILAHFRGFQLPKDVSTDRLQDWLKACKDREAVKTTLACEDKLLGIYQMYADDTATTEVAQAIRKGTAFP